MKNTVPLFAAAALLAATVPSGAAHAQKAKKPAAKKPPHAAPRPAAPKQQTIVLGTQQLPGDFGKFGQTYTIGRPNENATNFTLDRAEYSVAPFLAGDYTVYPEKNEKLLVLHYTLHNPNPAEQHVDWGSIGFTVVDSKDVNHENEHFAVREGTRDASLSLDLKPAQKLSLVTVVKVPAEKVTPKLIVKRDDSSAVIRYDLRGKVAPLTAPFADPADANTARGDVPAATGVFFPMGQIEARLDSVSYTSEQVYETAPEEGGRFLVAAFTLRNPTGADLHYDWGTLTPEMTDSDGDKAEFNNTLLKASKDEVAAGDLRPGEEVRVRYFFPVGGKTTAKSLRMAAGEAGRSFVFDLSGAK